MNSEIENYINNNIIPLYKENDVSHSISHVNDVIKNSLQLGKKYNLREDLLYIISAYHDVGARQDRDTHEVISAEFFYNDKFWEGILSKKERKLIYDAIIDHRASSRKVPRSIYGRVVATADRQFDSFESAVKRTYLYLMNKFNNKTMNEIYELIYNDFNNRYGKYGYVKVFFNVNLFQKELQPIKELLLNKNKFIEKIKTILEEGK